MTTENCEYASGCKVKPLVEKLQQQKSQKDNNGRETKTPSTPDPIKRLQVEIDVVRCETCDEA